jgi:hypothetical protein
MLVLWDIIEIRVLNKLGAKLGIGQPKRLLLAK